MKNKTECCPYCLPQKVKWHFGSKISYYTDKIKNILRFFGIDFYLESTNIFNDLFMNFLRVVGLVKYVKEIEKGHIKNRHLIFFNEAKKRGLNIYAIKFLGKYTDEFVLILNGKKCFYQGNPLYILPHKLHINIDDKYIVKKFLKLNNLPIAEGKVFINIKKAIDFGQKLGFPLVVKPRSGSLSKHVVVNIKNIEELKEAIEIVKCYRKDFIVEKFITGRLYRATIIGQKYVFVCEKDASNIIGDGVSTIEKLILLENSMHDRGEQNDKEKTLHKISIDEDFLRKQNLTVQNVPAFGQKTYLNDKTTLSSGCDIIDCSKETDISNKNMFLNIAKIVNSQLLGIDFICPDISISYKNQISGILELNSLPYIDMHEFPSHGEKNSVANMAWDLVLENWGQPPFFVI